MQCYKCGKQLSPQEKFCYYCGAHIKSNADNQEQAPYNYQQASQFSTNIHQPAPIMSVKSRKKSLLIVLIFFIVLIVIALYFGFSTGFIKNISNSFKYRNQLVLHDLRAKYPSDWSKTDIDSKSISLAKKSNIDQIIFNYFKSDFYYEPSVYIDRFLNEYKENWDNFKVVSDVETVLINDINWQKFEFYGTFNDRDLKCVQMMMSTGYKVYSVVYVCPTEDFEKYFDDVLGIMKSVSIT